MENKFLPVTRAEMEERGWDQVDFVYISGDAYVDHPSFGHAIITRLLEAHGYRVGMISQPDWKDKESITVFGEPRLAFSCISRKYGFYGKPLQRFKKTQKQRLIYSGRCNGEAAGLCLCRLRQSDPSDI